MSSPGEEIPALVNIMRMCVCDIQEACLQAEAVGYSGSAHECVQVGSHLNSLEDFCTRMKTCVVLVWVAAVWEGR